MTAPHFFVEHVRGLGPGARISLSEDDSRHALRSLRLRQGEEVTLADDAGAVATGHLAGQQDGLATVDVDAVRRVVRRGPIVSVALSPPKGDRLTWAVQKLGELGVDWLVLMSTELGVREWDRARADRVTARLGTVAREAAMQSRRPFVMRVLAAVSLEEALSVQAGLVVLWEGAEDPLRSALRDDEVAVRMFVGPEGGFSDQEVETATQRGARSASLGPGILRTETAAVVGAALVLARYGRLG